MEAILIDRAGNREVTLHDLTAIPAIGSVVVFDLNKETHSYGVIGVQHTFRQVGKKLKQGRIVLITEPLKPQSSIVQATQMPPGGLGQINGS